MFDVIGHIFGFIGATLAGGLIALAGFISPISHENVGSGATSTIVVIDQATTTTEKVIIPVKVSKSITPSAPPSEIMGYEPTKPEVASPSPNDVPGIISFDVLPKSAYYGDDLTFTWTTRNSINCLVPVSDPSEVVIPFTGRLPKGSTTYQVVDATGVTKTMTFWIVCAGKDWVTTTAQVTAQLLAPHIIGKPNAENDGEGNRFVYAMIRGAPKVRITCVVANYNGSNPPNVVDALVYPNEDTRIVAAPIPDTLIAGLTLSCIARFNTGIEEQFVVNVPTR